MAPCARCQSRHVAETHNEASAIHRYTCQKCQHEFEALVYDGEKVECPQCQGTRVERQFSVPARPRAATATLPMGGCEGSGR